MKHKVVITEKISRTVEIEAKSGEEAVEFARRRCLDDTKTLPPNVTWDFDVCLLID